MIYDGIARGRKRITSKKFLPLKLLVETNQAGIIPKKRENNDANYNHSVGEKDNVNIVSSDCNIVRLAY